MKKFVLFLIFCLYWPLSVHAIGPMMMGGGVSATTVNYCDDANCQGCWYLNGTTTETDRSGNGNTLSAVSGTPAQSATVPSGYAGKSRDFEEDETDYLSRADGDLVGLDITGNSMSIVAWIYIESASAMGVACKYVAEDGKRQYELTISTNVIVAHLSANGTAVSTFTGDTATLTTATWYHVAMVANGTDVRLYLNGALDSASPGAWSSNIYDGTASFTIGSRGTSLLFDGLIDEVAVFNRGLSAAEILDIYTNGISGNKGGSD